MEHTYARSRTFLVALGSILITVAAAATAAADTINLAWDPNRESTLQGYMVHVGTQSGTYTQHIDVGLNTSYGWPSAVAGQRYCFAVSAYVAGHLEGPKSNEVCGFSNAAPVLANPGGRSSVVGQPTSLQLQGSDPDGQAVTYTANGMPPGLSVMVGTGFISGTPTSAGTYSVTATVSDGVLQASQTFTWTITAAAGDSTSPLVTITGPTSAATFTTTSSTLSLSGTASDNVGVTQVTWVNDRGGNGVGTGTTTWSIGGVTLAAGTNNITVTARDAAGNVGTDVIAVSVNANVNVAPTLAAVSNQSTVVGQTVSLQLVGSDANSNPLTYSATGLPAGLSVAASTGLIAGAPVTAGTYSVTASVSDGSLSATRTFTWTVSAGVPTSPAPTPIAFLQGNYAVPQTPQSSVTVSFPGAQSAGNLNVVAIGWNDATSQVVSVTDARGNAYTRALATVQAGVQSQAIYYAANIAAGSTNSITVRFNTAVSFPDVRIAEYRGISAVTPVDGVRGATGTGTALTSGAVTTTAANVLLVGASYVQTVTTGAGSGYMSRMITTPNGSILEDRVVSAVGSYSATASSTGMGWVMQSVAFRGVGSSTGTDTAAPAIVITSPTSGTTFTTTASTLTLGGTASDNVGVTQVTWVNDRGGSGTATGTTSWSISGIALAANANTITVSARDAAGNTATDVITVTSSSVTPPPSNTAPAVNAGADQAVTLPSSVTLAGTATDDGQPTPSALITAWSKVSGPGTVTFGNSAALNTSATFSAAGAYVLRLSASDGALTSSDDLTVTVNATTTSGAGLRGEYFSGTAFGSLLVTRVDPTVNFNWGSGTPGSGLPADNFSVRWTGDVIAPVTGTYTFTTVSDDGVRLWVNSQQVIGNWSNHAAATDTSAGITLQAGQHYPIRLEYYEAGGLSEIRLQWSYSGQATQAIPQSALSPTSGGTVPDPTPTPTPSGLVAAYSFNASTGTTVADSSGMGNHGTANTTAAWSAGKFGNAMRFNGSNSVVTVPDSASLDLTTAMTLEAWVMPAAAQGGWRSVMHKNVDRYYLMASSDNNSPVGGGTFGAGNQNTYAASALPINVWTHLATTFDGKTVKLYVNGIQVASMPQATSITTSGGTLQIGGDGYGEFFNGSIDEIRIYNRALSAAEIQSTMNAPVQ
ncbi:MAG TPA: PA14 domain-containing protein [Vicinamibacterales bacterium]|jgi:hypothetical protein